MGKPFELSPKARVKSWLGFGEPFDRHDWHVDRGDGEEVRYILDYYFDEKAAETDTDPQSTKCIYVDVRPALDSPRAALDRLLAFPGRALEAVTNFRTFADGSDPDAVPEKFSQALGGGGRGRKTEAAESAETDATHAANAAAERLAALDRKCNPFRVKLSKAQDEESRSVAFVALTYCMGADSCKPEADAFLQAAEATTAVTPESTAFEALHTCVVANMETDLATAKQAEQRA
jgi:cytochrome c heme-lyase